MTLKELRLPLTYSASRTIDEYDFPSVYCVYFKKFQNLDINPKRVDLINNVTHVFLINVRATSLENVYQRMQSEFWSPNGEANKLLELLKLKHSSMSIGDAILDPSVMEFFLVDNIGFKMIPE